MKKKRKTLAGRLSHKLYIWTLFVVLALSFVLIYFEGRATRMFYSEIYHNKMLIVKEYTRRVISDVYVAVTNNIYYLEHSLDKPEEHKATMERIVKSGTRVRSCGISFIEDYYYPQKGHRFCPFAWRNVSNPDEVFSEDMGDADLDYLTADWFLDVALGDSARWSEPFYDGYDETTTLAAYMVPIHDQEGRVVAVLGADISLDWLTGKLSEADSTVNSTSMFVAGQFAFQSHSFIVNYDGTFITHADEKQILKENFFHQLESCNGSDVESLVNRMKAGVECDELSSDRYMVNGEECYIFYTTVKYTRWLLITAIPCKSIDMLSYVNAVTETFIVILAILLIVIIAHYYIKSGVEPLSQLIELTDNMVKGQYDSAVPELKHDDEIRQLSDSIENLRFTLSSNADRQKRPGGNES